MEKNNHPLSDLQQLFAKAISSGEIVLRNDGVFERAPVGFFKIAYSAAHHTHLLYFARHPADFDRTTKIWENDHAYLVAIEEARHSPKVPHGARWLKKHIERVVDDLSCELLGDNLHRVDESTFVSLFIAYQKRPIEDKANTAEIIVAADTDSEVALLEMPPPPHTPRRGQTIRLFRKAGRHLLGWASKPSHFRLGVRFEIENDSGLTSMRDAHIFEEDAVFPAIREDFIRRVMDLWKGVDPIKWRENRLLPLVRIHVKLIGKIKEATETFQEDKRRGIASLAAAAIHVAETGFFSFGAIILLEKAGEVFGLHEGSRHVPKKWWHLLDPETKVLSVQPHHARTLIRTKKEQFAKTFADLKWATAEDLTSGFSIKSDTSLLTDTGFSTWLKGQFFIPYASIFEHIGEGENNLVGLKDVSKIKLIRLNAPNGLQMYFMPESQTLFAYYHEPKLRTKPEDASLPQQFLAVGAEKIFTGEKVLKIDLSQPEKQSWEPIDFDLFAKTVHQRLGAKGDERMMRLLRPHKYIPPEPASVETQLHQKKPTQEACP